MARFTRNDVISAVKRDFPSENPETVLNILDEYGTDAHERERVQIAILKLSVGNLTHLRNNVDDAKKDYRDILWSAESPPTDEEQKKLLQQIGDIIKDAPKK